MPTVLRTQGFRFYFYSHEGGEPAHVHIDRGGASAKIWLQAVSVAGNAGFAAKDLGTALRLTRKHQSQLLEAWNEFFGSA